MRDDYTGRMEVGTAGCSLRSVEKLNRPICPYLTVFASPPPLRGYVRGIRETGFFRPARGNGSYTSEDEEEEDGKFNGEERKKGKERDTRGAVGRRRRGGARGEVKGSAESIRFFSAAVDEVGGERGGGGRFIRRYPA